MPQLDPSTYVSQLFWLFLSVTILWAILSFGVLPPLKLLFQKRQRYLEEMQQETHKLHAQAESLILESQEKLRLIRVSSEQQIKACVQDSHEKIRHTKETLALEAQQHMSDAFHRMEALKQDTLEDLSIKIPDIAAALMTQLTRRYLPKEGSKRL